LRCSLPCFSSKSRRITSLPNSMFLHGLTWDWPSVLMQPSPLFNFRHLMPPELLGDVFSLLAILEYTLSNRKKITYAAIRGHEGTKCALTRVFACANLAGGLL
jgi:hypothetical protein